MKNLTRDFYKLMEIYFDKVILFPYMLLDEIQERYQGAYDDCNIYMLMLRDKLEIEKISNKKDKLQIKYRNVSTNKTKIVSLYYRDLYGIEIPARYVETSIEKFGEIVKIEINKEVFDTMKIMWGFLRDMSNILICNIYDIITMSEREKETYEEYEVIYIGQSNPKKEYRTIFDRLRKHEKIASVFREYNLEYRDKELMVYILHTKTKLLNMDGLLFLGSTEWQKCDKVGERMDDTAMIDITEAMLIYHFKPHYNIKLKDSMPSINMKVYKQLVEAGLNYISLGMDLYLQTYKNCIALVTKMQRTTTRFRILKCNVDALYYNSENADIVYEDVADELYKIIQG